MSSHHSEQMSQRSQVSRIALRISLSLSLSLSFYLYLSLSFSLSLSLSLSLCQVMSPELSDQMFQRSQVSGVALCMSKVKVP